ncbi:MAG: protease [Chlorobi bacterium]|nr:protease [Chlorobiota bacterium]
MIRKFTTIVLFIFISSNTFSQQDARLLRFPAIYNNQVVFTYAGDLYTVEKDGGIARKLTSNKGFEMFAKFSPDGSEIAFTGQYDGNTEVYVIPSVGGTPKRVTYTATLGRDDISDRMGPNNIVMAWTKDGNNIVYRSRKQSFNSFIGQLFSVSKEGGLSTELPLPTGGFCSYSPDGKKLAFNRVFREFRTWKYYKGGMADDIWIYDFETKTTENITNNIAQDIFPMWHKNEIFFLSDRDHTMNLFSYNADSKEIEKLTNYDKYDIKFPSLGTNEIIYENGGYLYYFDFKTRTPNKIEIQIANDFRVNGKTLKDATKNINSSNLSPNGERIIFSARGDIFTVPAKSGITKNLTESSGVHERAAKWSPDGKYIAYISDKTGEDEIYITKGDGSGKQIQLTFNTNIYKFSLEWSPDSKMILYSDQHFKLNYVNIETKKLTEVSKGEKYRYYNYNWSPDSKWITFDEGQKEGMTKVFLYNLSTKVKTEVTKGWFYSSQPSFSSDGKFLVFVSSRDFTPTYSDVEWNYAYEDMARIYIAILDKETPSPFAPENDVVKIEKTDENKKKDEKNKQENSFKIDLNGLTERIISLPVKPSNYWNPSIVGNSVYYMERSQSNNKTAFKMYDLKKKKETVLGEKLSYTLSSNNKKMLIRKSKKYYVIDKPVSKLTLEKPADLSGMKVNVDLHKEWKQIYTEAWRQMRDFFFAPNMKGLDWQAMYDKYAELLPYVNHRADLNYLIGELIGELSLGHTYVGNGDRALPERIKMGLLGAKISKDASGYYKIDEILKGANWNKAQRSPLTEIGVKAHTGDFIIAINGKQTNLMNDPFEALIGMNGKQVELTLNTKPEISNSWKTIIVPVENESELYYYKWVQGNLKKVTKATNGTVGYIHIPDMMSYGLNEFVKYYYPQLTKKGLIIDDRGNGGGNVSAMIIERLMRELTYINSRRNIDYGTTSPGDMLLGPKVMLIDNYSASDGDLVAYRFKKNKIGKVIGVRSWGGVVGIAGSLPFIDGGMLTTPTLAPYASDGSGWIIEGYGVDPDIVIDNDPAKQYAGEDQQLNKAIEVILEEIKNFKQEIPPLPPYPDKTK